MVGSSALPGGSDNALTCRHAMPMSMPLCLPHLGQQCRTCSSHPMRYLSDLAPRTEDGDASNLQPRSVIVLLHRQGWLSCDCKRCKFAGAAASIPESLQLPRVLAG